MRKSQEDPIIDSGWQAIQDYWEVKIYPVLVLTPGWLSNIKCFGLKLYTQAANMDLLIYIYIFLYT